MKALFFVVGLILGIIFGYSLSNYFLNKKTHLTQSEVSKSSTESSSPVCPTCECQSINAKLAPPKFAEDIPEQLKTDNRGEVNVHWHEEPTAYRYFVRVVDSKDKEIQLVKTKKNRVFLKNIPIPAGEMEAHYFVYLTSVDENDNEGKPSEKRPLHVISQSLISAPEVQQITVEE